jgi:hypothetical protein
VTAPSRTSAVGIRPAPLVTIRGPESPDLNRTTLTMTPTAMSRTAAARTTRAVRIGRIYEYRVIELLPYELNAGSIQSVSFNGNHHGVVQEKSAS